MVKASSPESSSPDCASVDAQLKRFYRLWCLKESIVKALDIDSDFDLKSIEFTIQDEEETEKVICLSFTLIICCFDVSPRRSFHVSLFALYAAIDLDPLAAQLQITPLLINFSSSSHPSLPFLPFNSASLPIFPPHSIPKANPINSHRCPRTKTRGAL